MNHIASNGPVVLTERTDVLERGAWRAEFWVCGTFEVHDDRITLWRDHFDWTTVLTASAKDSFSLINPALNPAHRLPWPNDKAPQRRSGGG